jgi:regulator of nucleoside diphosphate kinase
MSFMEYEMHLEAKAEMRPPIAIDANHFARLSALSSLTSGPMIDVCEYLREELDRAYVLPVEKLRPDIVSLGSRVEFRDEQTGKIQEIILVYPLDADITRRRVSVLTPVGAALLGLSVNQTISFHTRTGERRELTVLRVSRSV